jgi:hypothetical protein
VDAEKIVQYPLETRPCCPGCFTELDNVVSFTGWVGPPPVGAVVVCTECAEVLTLTESRHWQKLDVGILPPGARVAIASMVDFVKRHKAEVD